MLRVVLDTNVWVSGIIHPRRICGQILNAWRKEIFDVVISPEIIEEIKHVFTYPKIRRHNKDIEGLLSVLFVNARIVIPSSKIKVISEDPPDDKFLACAVTGSVAYIVSGDKHLLKLEAYQGIQILPPAKFLKTIVNVLSHD